MVIELIKPIVKVGNGAGVVLPREWYGGRARVELINSPLNIKEDIFEIIKIYLNEVMGIYIVGSYAREEEKPESDVDVLVITSDINKIIKKGKYEIMLISKENVEKSLKKNILPLLPMLKEAKAILNKDLILDYKKTPLTKENLKWHIETTKSALKMNEAAINLDKDTGVNAGDAVAYSLILRLREVYILNCLIRNKLWNNREFIKLIKTISGSLNAYKGYLRIKRKLKTKEELPIKETEKLIKYISDKIRKQEKWLIKRK